MCNEGRTYGTRLVLVLFALLLVLLLTPFLEAQIHGVPASVTSLDNSNHTLFNPPGVPASVTSLGPQGFTPFGNGRSCCFNFRTDNNRPFFTGRHHRDRDNGLVGGGAVAYPVYVPYYYPVENGASMDDNSEDSASAGPTIFDRHSNGRSSLASENELDKRLDRLEQKVDEAESSNGRVEGNEIAPARSAPDQPATVLVYRDGHSLEIKNYVIVGDTLYDYSAGARRKIALSELDLTATQKQNDDRGVDFRIPSHSGN